MQAAFGGETMGETIPVTPKGRKLIEERIAGLEAQQTEVRKAVGEAREKGDLNENAEYHAAMEKLRMLEAQTNELRGRLARSQIVDPRRAPRDRVAFGARVRVLNLDTEKEESYELVGLGEDDASANRILTTSPTAQGLLLKKVGEEAEVKAPQGEARYRVLGIEYPS
jgi:transcription elongation factor GreA